MTGNPQAALELAYWLVAVGYAGVWAYAVYMAAWRLRRSRARVKALLWLVASTSWLVFYLWSATADLSDPAVVDTGVLLSRLAQLPTIGAAFALLSIARLEQDEQATLRPQLTLTHGEGEGLGDV